MLTVLIDWIASISVPSGAGGRPALAGATVLAAPCVTTADGDRDGLPTVILEAMACGVPVVSTPISAIPELVVEGETGLLVAERDAQALAEALVRLADAPDLVVKLTRAARAAVEEHHDHGRNAARLAGLFREGSRCD